MGRTRSGSFRTYVARAEYPRATIPYELVRHPGTLFETAHIVTETCALHEYVFSTLSGSDEDEACFPGPLCDAAHEARFRQLRSAPTGAMRRMR